MEGLFESVIIQSSFLIILGAILLDLLLGDPKWLPHPVIGMGNVISFLEKRWNQGPRKKGKGIVLVLVVVGGSYLITFVLVYGAHQVHPLVGILFEIYLVSTTIAIKGLKEAATQVAVPLYQRNLSKARIHLSRIVGRDTQHLTESEIVRGTVETVAENTVDGITAPLFWACIGGAPLAMAYRAVNTLDSMVGYRNERYEHFGWASARIDDVLNWIPARLTSCMIWISSWFVWLVSPLLGLSIPCHPSRALRITFRDARLHPSPNSGWSEAMMAGLLGVQLGGLNTYQGLLSKRAKLGDRLRELGKEDIDHSIVYMHGGWIVFCIMILIIKILWMAG